MIKDFYIIVMNFSCEIVNWESQEEVQLKKFFFMMVNRSQMPSPELQPKPP